MEFCEEVTAAARNGDLFCSLETFNPLRCTEERAGTLAEQNAHEMDRFEKALKILPWRKQASLFS